MRKTNNHELPVMTRSAKRELEKILGDEKLLKKYKKDKNLKFGLQIAERRLKKETKKKVKEEKIEDEIKFWDPEMSIIKKKKCLLQLEADSDKIINRVSSYIQEMNLKSVLDSCRHLVEKNTGRKMKILKEKKIEIEEPSVSEDQEEEESMMEIKSKKIKKVKRKRAKGGRKKKKRSKSLKPIKRNMKKPRRRGRPRTRNSSVARSYISKGEVFRMNLTTF